MTATAIASNTATVARFFGDDVSNLWAAVYVEPDGGGIVGVALIHAFDYFSAADQARVDAGGLDFQLVEGVDVLVPAKNRNQLGIVLNQFIGSMLAKLNAEAEATGHATA